LLTPERTIQRKLKELVLSWFTEFIYSKDEIMELYLNHIPYGGTAYGIEQASQLYFGKPASQLNLAESALIAGLPQAPSRYSPFGSAPELAKERQKAVLTRMYEDGYISESEMEVAKNEDIVYAKQRTDIKAPHFVMYVKDLLVDKYGQLVVEQGGLRVTTSLDLGLQEAAQASLSAEIAKLENYQVGNGAAIVTKPSTGEVLAMIGSKDYFDEEIDGNVNLTTSLRQPGSSIKPLNYALGLSKGYTAATLFLDIPTCFTAPGQPKAYCPKNYDGSFHGPQQMRQSLANSYNIPAVKMLAMNGIEDFIATASAMGITTWGDSSNYGLSLTLGGGEVRMVDMATAFGVFANSGIRIDLNPILKVETYTGQVLEENDHETNPPAGVRVLSPGVSFIISHILSDNNARIPAFGPNSQLVIPGKTVSVKTGTTDNLRDNWTVGYTPEYVTTVWVGNNDNTPMNPYLVSGVTGAAPIWNDIMSFILKDKGEVIPPKPEQVIGGTVCLTQQDPNQPCEGRFEYFIKGTERNQLHGEIAKKNIWIDKGTGLPPEPGVTENLELQEHLVTSDELTKEFCLDCVRPEGQSFETKLVNLQSFYEMREQQNSQQTPQ
jgi:membrane peptidoglycan carboxypeptidase